MYAQPIKTCVRNGLGGNNAAVRSKMHKYGQHLSDLWKSQNMEDISGNGIHPQSVSYLNAFPRCDPSIHCAKNKRNTACKIRPAKIHAVIDGKYAQIHQLGVFPTFP